MFAAENIWSHGRLVKGLPSIRPSCFALYRTGTCKKNLDLDLAWSSDEHLHISANVRAA